MINKNETYHNVSAKSDVESFINLTNGLHDGYIIGVQYEHNGHICGNPHLIDDTHSNLTIRIMVTSTENSIVEIKFSSIKEWQIGCDNYEITDTSVFFKNDGDIIWTDDRSFNYYNRKNYSYVIARKMEWRFI